MNNKSITEKIRIITLVASVVLLFIALVGLFYTAPHIIHVFGLLATLGLGLLLLTTVIINIIRLNHSHWVFLVLFVLYMAGLIYIIDDLPSAANDTVTNYINASLILAFSYVVYLFIRSPKTRNEKPDNNDEILDQDIF